MTITDSVIMQPRNPKTGQWMESPNLQFYLQKKPDGSKYKLGYYDIEVSSLSANRGFMLMWSIKERDNNKIVTSVITKKEIDNRTFDKRIAKEFVEEASKYDILAGYYSSVFDASFIRSSCMKHNIDFIGFKQKYHMDLYFACRGKIATDRKSLKKICEFLKIKGKVDLTDEEWMLAQMGDTKALNKLIERNKFDCIILEKLHKRFEPYVRFNKNWL